MPLPRAPLPSASSALRARSLAAAALLVAACATVPPPPETAIPAVSPLADAAFALDGRLSARRGADAVAVGFAWVHEPPHDTLVVTSPLGQTLAELEGATGRRVRLTLADGRTSEDDDWSALTARMLGFPLPVDALAAWVRASPHGGSAYVVEPDGGGRVALLRQEGWEIAFGYSDADARRPVRLRLSSADTEVRIVIERWR